MSYQAQPEHAVLEESMAAEDWATVKDKGKYVIAT